jgi:hypothetical protein
MTNLCLSCDHAILLLFYYLPTLYLFIKNHYASIYNTNAFSHGDPEAFDKLYFLDFLSTPQEVLN